MSLETEIAGLTSKATALIDYFTGAKNSIAAAVAAAVAAAPAISRTFYVSQLTGDDNALGTIDAPFKTIFRAISATPKGGTCEVLLRGNYTLKDSNILNNRRLVIRGESGVASETKLIIEEYTAGGVRAMGQFQGKGDVSFEFTDMTLSLPDSSAGSGALSTYYAFIYAGGNSMPGFLPVKLYNFAFELRGTFAGKFIGAGVQCLALSAVNTTIPAALEGSLVTGVAAGKDPSTLPNVITNIAKL